MSLQKTEAVILRGINHGETSKILTVYTREFGKVAVMAKGSRSSKSRFGGTLEPLNHLSILFYEKKSREVQLLNQADLISAFPAIHADLEKTAIALAVCELLNQLQVGQEPNPLLFRLLLSTLNSIAAAGNNGMNCFRAFQIHLFDIMGFRPHFYGCIGCQTSVSGSTPFDLTEGGLTCPDCRRPTVAAIVLTDETLRLLQNLQKIHISRLDGFMPSAAAQSQVDNFLRSYLHHHVEGVRELKSLQFLQRI